MRLERVTKQKYAECITQYTTIFDSPQFNEINCSNCDEIYYFLASTRKIKFGLIFGLRQNILYAPFSAPYYLPSIARDDIKLLEYDELIAQLMLYCTQNTIDELRFTLPPVFYAPDTISCFENCFFRAGFSISHIDLNYHYPLSHFSDRYLETLVHHNARKNLKNALQNELHFHPVDKNDRLLQQAAYEVICRNREVKGYPLKLSFEKIEMTSQVIKADWFLVLNKTNNDYLASALCFHVSDKIVQVVYWGDHPDHSHLRPMNFLAYKIFEYYHQRQLDYVDIGPSTERGVPNFGLCDFKQSVGCMPSSKMTFVKKCIASKVS